MRNALNRTHNFKWFDSKLAQKVNYMYVNELQKLSHYRSLIINNSKYDLQSSTTQRDIS